MSKVFKLFENQYVSLVMKNMRAQTSSSKIANLLLAGYLVEECDTYFYLGEEEGSVTAAVKKDEVASVMLATEGEEDFELPDDAEMQ